MMNKIILFLNLLFKKNNLTDENSPKNKKTLNKSKSSKYRKNSSQIKKRSSAKQNTQSNKKTDKHLSSKKEQSSTQSKAEHKKNDQHTKQNIIQTKADKNASAHQQVHSSANIESEVKTSAPSKTGNIQKHTEQNVIQTKADKNDSAHQQIYSSSNIESEESSLLKRYKKIILIAQKVCENVKQFKCAESTKEEYRKITSRYIHGKNLNLVTSRNTYWKERRAILFTTKEQLENILAKIDTSISFR